ncbi:hypothetical protein [Methylobacterium organophilum]|uniref:Uncharacterized protein n=1 Tax=Methylobacterium organophilum TaxID=410 RepID=A0ABQ4TCG9_METOR|nr:hypothetical protein [Methylobacterium organophilum]UMY18653.1 hypothetical protein MMB17_04820 [Methylobacterium organophilum]GJE29401.1 hypothetical protein LKMONMHP_4282 [Methylobacterium organophilum]
MSAREYSTAYMALVAPQTPIPGIVMTSLSIALWLVVSYAEGRPVWFLN